MLSSTHPFTNLGRISNMISDTDSCTLTHYLPSYRTIQRSRKWFVGTGNEWMNEFNSLKGRWARHSATDCPRCFTQAAALNVNMHVIYAGVIAEIERVFFYFNEGISPSALMHVLQLCNAQYMKKRNKSSTWATTQLCLYPSQQPGMQANK